MSFLSRLAFAFVFLFSYSGANASVRIPTPDIEKLPNGLTLVWFQDDALPVVDFALMVDAGNRDDAPGKSGTSELVSAVLDRGAGGLSAQEIALRIESLGATRSVAAGEESFSIGMHGLAPDAKVLLEMLGRIALHPDFPAEEVAREQRRMLDRWSHISDYAESLALLGFSRLVSANTPYGRGSLAGAAELKKIKRSDVIEYHTRYFVPERSVLMVVGRIDRPQIRAQIGELFGAWKGHPQAKSTRVFSDPRLKGISPGEIVVIDRPKLTQAQVRIGGVGPRIQVPERYPLAVANALLGEYFGSRLNSVLRDQMGLTYSIGSSFSFARDLGRFEIASSTRNEATGTLVKRTFEVLRGLYHGPVGEEETRQAKEYLAGGFPLSVSTLSSIASRWLGGYLLNLPADDLNRFVPGVEAVTAPQVLAAVKKYIVPEKMFVVVAGDGTAIVKSLKAAGFTRIRRLTVKDLL